MQKYIFVIAAAPIDGSLDLDCNDDLYEAFQTGALEDRDASIFKFELDEAVHPMTALLVGRGRAFGSDWCMDGTMSILLKLDDDGTVKQLY